MTAQSAERVMRTDSAAARVAGYELRLLQIDSAGGSPRDSVRLGNFLADLDQSRVRTVAYIPQQARGDAIIVALACDHTVVHPEAVLGGSGAATIDEAGGGSARADPPDRPAKVARLVVGGRHVRCTAGGVSYTRAGTANRLLPVGCEFAEKFGEAASRSGR